MCIRNFLKSLAKLSFLLIATHAHPDHEKISEALGHMIGKNLQLLKVPLNMEAIAKGLQDEAAGLSSSMNEEDCLIQLRKIQEDTYLLNAEKFLETNGKKKEVISLQGGKLQFEILKKGEGQPVQSYNSPIVKLIKEGDFPASYTTEPAIEELIALDETIPGLKYGITGMKEGEIRRIYIHPDLGPTIQPFDPPKSLLIFQVEVLRADASSDAHAASSGDPLPIFRELDDVHPSKR